ncbi:MAG: gamma-glutamylcyclotransferase [Pseudomonadota bacterium]
MQRGDLWVFGYGSLMWRPGFPFKEKRLARLDGYRRRFAMWSWHYRGTRSRPGLVLGLDWAPGESCEGMAFRVGPDDDRAVRDYLQQRELVSYAYFEIRQTVTLTDGPDQRVDALCYVLDRTHEQYAGPLDPERQADVIAAASGQSGPNAEYLISTVSHMAEIGLRDEALDGLTARVLELRRP